MKSQLDGVVTPSSRYPTHFLIACFLWSLCIAAHTSAQPNDSFDDGEFFSSPPWYGDVDRWQIGDLNGPALQARGLARADTIHLATQSSEAFGTWYITFAHKDVNLSSFNGARVFFVSDRQDARAEATGYYIQLGTNNADRISLWRADGHLGGRRTELARSDEPLLAGDSARIRLRIDRDIRGTFDVYAEDSLLFAATDSSYASASFFVIWVKHSTQAAESFFFDDIAFEPPDEDQSPVALPGPRDIVLNELQFNPAPGASEFIELLNRSDSAFDASHLRIRDAVSANVSVTSEPKPLEPQSFLVLVQDSAMFAQEFRTVPFLHVRNWPSLNNAGDIVVLSTVSTTIDSLEFDGSSGVQGRSLERIDPDGPTHGFNFTASIDGFGSTPGERNSVHAVDVAPPAVRFVDQLDSTRLRIHLTEPILAGVIDAESIEYEQPVERVDSLTPFSLDVTLRDSPAAATLRLFGLRDFKGNTADAIDAPIAFLGRPGDLLINEIMYEPRSDPHDGLPDQSEFIELVNVSGRMVSLTHLMRTRGVDETGDADTLRFGRSYGSVVPGGSVVIAVTDSAGVRSAYPTTIPDPSAVFMMAPGLTLLNGGDRVAVHNRIGTILDDLNYAPSWHHPDRQDRRGASLERIDLETPSNIAANWSSSVSPDGASPGAANAIAFTPPTIEAESGVSIQPSPFSPDGDGIADVTFISYRLTSPVSNIRVRIFDVNGIEVRRLISAALTGSTGSVVWDGRNEDGHLVPIGIYIVLLESVGTDGNSVGAYKRPVVLARQF